MCQMSHHNSPELMYPSCFFFDLPTLHGKNDTHQWNSREWKKTWFKCERCGYNKAFYIGRFGGGGILKIHFHSRIPMPVEYCLHNLVWFYIGLYGGAFLVELTSCWGSCNCYCLQNLHSHSPCIHTGSMGCIKIEIIEQILFRCQLTTGLLSLALWRLQKYGTKIWYLKYTFQVCTSSPCVTAGYFI